jgi:hypothetical protein
MFRVIEALTGRGEVGLIRTPRREVRRLETHFSSRPVEPTIEEVLAIFRANRGDNPQTQAEVLKKISGKWVQEPDAKIEDQLGEFIIEIAELDDPLRPSTASSGIDVVVFAPQVPHPATWRMTVSSQVEERFGAGTAKYDTRQREWYTSQDPHRKKLVRSVDIRQKVSA